MSAAPGKPRTRDELWSSIISHLMSSRAVAVQASTPTDFVIGKVRLSLLSISSGFLSESLIASVTHEFDTWHLCTPFFFTLCASVCCDLFVLIRV